MEVAAEAEVCPICGYEFPRRRRAVQVTAWIMIALLLIWFLL